MIEIKPMMSELEISCIAKNLDSNDTMVEFGCGGSTLLFSRYVKTYLSIESNGEYYNKIRPHIPDNCTIMLATPEGSVTSSGKYDDNKWMALVNSFPPEAERWNKSLFAKRKLTIYYNYLNIINFIADCSIDKILIDGRARVYCALMLKSKLKPSGLMFMHDFVNREEYHEILSDYKLVNRVGTLGVFETI